MMTDSSGGGADTNAALSMTVFCYDYVQAWSSEDSAFIPVIRVFGTTSSRQRACAHVHGFFPYLYFRPLDMADPTFAREEDVKGCVGHPGHMMASCSLLDSSASPSFSPFPSLLHQLAREN